MPSSLSACVAHCGLQWHVDDQHFAGQSGAIVSDRATNGLRSRGIYSPHELALTSTGSLIERGVVRLGQPFEIVSLEKRSEREVEAYTMLVEASMDSCAATSTRTTECATVK